MTSGDIDQAPNENSVARAEAGNRITADGGPERCRARITCRSPGVVRQHDVFRPLIPSAGVSGLLARGTVDLGWSGRAWDHSNGDSREEIGDGCGIVGVETEIGARQL